MKTDNRNETIHMNAETTKKSIIYASTLLVNTLAILTPQQTLGTGSAIGASKIRSPPIGVLTMT